MMQVVLKITLSAPRTHVLAVPRQRKMLLSQLLNQEEDDFNSMFHNLH